MWSGESVHNFVHARERRCPKAGSRHRRRYHILSCSNSQRLLLKRHVSRGLGLLQFVMPVHALVFFGGFVLLAKDVLLWSTWLSLVRLGFRSPTRLLLRDELLGRGGT